MDSDLAKKIKKLSVPEKILLVEEIWDDIARKGESFELSESQKKELDRRLRFFSENPSQGRTWEEIRDEFLKL